MLRLSEGLTFDNFDTPPMYQGIEGDFVPESIKEQLQRVGATTENLGSAIAMSGAGLVVIVGSALIPQKFKWAPYLRLAGIIGGATLAIGGAAYAFKKPDEGAVPGATNLFVAPEIVLAAEQGWKIFGTARIDLTITNRTGNPLLLLINAQDYLGTNIGQNRLEMTWNPQTLSVPANGSASTSFYFVNDKIKSAPGPRTAVFVIQEMPTGRQLAIWQQTVNFS